MSISELAPRQNSANPKPVCTCPRQSDRFYLLNLENGDSIPLDCNTYACPVCGPKKLIKLRKAVAHRFEGYKYIRMLTLTMHHSLMQDQIEHYKLLSECWRRFTTEIRRNKALSPAQNAVQYFKCLDYHKDGYVHFHIIVTEYIPRSILQGIWERVCQKVLKTDKHCANADIRALPNAKAAAYYVVKYVIKAIKYVPYTNKRYSKSRDIVLFATNKPISNWIMVDGCLPLFDQVSATSPGIPFTSLSYSATSQIFSVQSDLFTVNST